MQLQCKTQKLHDSTRTKAAVTLGRAHDLENLRKQNNLISVATTTTTKKKKKKLTAHVVKMNSHPCCCGIHCVKKVTLPEEIRQVPAVVHG
jgi:hypothetical protein